MLHLHFEHNMPNFSYFSVDIKGKQIEKTDSIELMWELDMGINELCVRAVNKFGRKGRVARIVVNYNK